MIHWTMEKLWFGARRSAVVLLGFGLMHGQTRLYELRGEPLEVFSFASTAGDLDLDGHSDFLVGGNLGVVRAYSGQTGLILHECYSFIPAVGIFDGLGSGISELGDVDGDGHPDVAVGASWSDTAAGGTSGAVVLFSGQTGKVLRVVDGPSSSDYFGNSLAAAGDVNLDGWPDFIAGAYGDGSAAIGGGTARVVSGLDGSELHKLEASIDAFYFGWTVDGGRDLNLDGHPDVVVGQRWRAAYAFSGADGSTLQVLVNDAFPENAWETTALLSDMDGDGRAEVAVGDPTYSTSVARVGAVRVFAGGTWNEIQTLTGFDPYESVGVGLARAGDVDLDGVEDLIAGATDCHYKPCQGTAPPKARVYSGATGEVLLELSDDEQPSSNFGYFVDRAGDVNGDGRPDLIVGSPYFDDPSVPGYGSNGRVQVFSSVKMPLTAATHLLHLAGGGTAVMGVHAGPEHAGELYFVLGSITGTSPGIPTDGGTLPLVSDAYFQFTLLHPSSPPLGASLGVLSGAGTSHPTFMIPGGLAASYFGLTAWHAAVLLDPATLAVTSTTNAVPLTLGDESLVH